MKADIYIRFNNDKTAYFSKKIKCLLVGIEYQEQILDKSAPLCHGLLPNEELAKISFIAKSPGELLQIICDLLFHHLQIKEVFYPGNSWERNIDYNGLQELELKGDLI